MLGEKRSQSLFAPKASAEKAAATHITTGPDGRKKELPLYFGPDCPVSGNMGQNQHEAGVGEPQPADEPLRHAPADDGTGVEADPTDTLMDLVTEAFPIVVFAKQLEDKSRKIMEIMECEILPTGERRYNTLYHFKIEENRLEDGKYRIKGRHEAVNPISESLQKRFIDNGMPQEVLTQLVGKKSAPSKGKSGSSPAKAGQATPAPKTRSAQSKPPAKPETGKEGGESV